MKNKRPLIALASILAIILVAIPIIIEVRHSSSIKTLYTIPEQLCQKWNSGVSIKGTEVKTSAWEFKRAWGISGEKIKQRSTSEHYDAMLALRDALIRVADGWTKKPDNTQENMAEVIQAFEHVTATLSEKSSKPAATSMRADPRKALGELNREMAAMLLNERLKVPSVSEIKFSETGLQHAINDGVLDGGGPYRTTFRFADQNKAVQIFGDLIKDPNMRMLVNFGGELPCFTSPVLLAEKVNSVDGIADAGFGGGTIMTVQYTTDYVFPANTSPSVSRYIYSGSKDAAMFRKYDDGWRIEQLR